jgi:predicted ABC-class ATPase
MNEKRRPEQTDEEKRSRRFDDLQKRRDRILCHPDLGPRLLRREAARAGKQNGAAPEPVVDEVEQIVRSKEEIVFCAHGRFGPTLNDKVGLRREQRRVEP